MKVNEKLKILQVGLKAMGITAESTLATSSLSWSHAHFLLQENTYLLLLFSTPFVLSTVVANSGAEWFRRGFFIGFLGFLERRRDEFQRRRNLVKVDPVQRMRYGTTHSVDLFLPSFLDRKKV